MTRLTHGICRTANSCVSNPCGETFCQEHFDNRSERLQSTALLHHLRWFLSKWFDFIITEVKSRYRRRQLQLRKERGMLFVDMTSKERRMHSVQMYANSVETRTRLEKTAKRTFFTVPRVCLVLYLRTSIIFCQFSISTVPRTVLVLYSRTSSHGVAREAESNPTWFADIDFSFFVWFTNGRMLTSPPLFFFQRREMQPQEDVARSAGETRKRRRITRWHQFPSLRKMNLCQLRMNPWCKQSQ